MPQPSTVTTDPAAGNYQRRQAQPRGRQPSSTGERGSSSAGSRTIAQSLQEYGRGLAGGILFSLPLLYTMEVWWAGFSIHPWRLAAAVVATFVLLLGYNRYAGLHNDASMAEVAIDSVEELGIGIVIAALVLWLLGRVTLDLPLNESVGKIIVEALTVAIGVSVGTAQLGGGDDAESGMTDDDSQGDQAGGEHAANASDSNRKLIGQLALMCCGAVLIGANVAPTEEIIMLAVEISPWRLIALIIISLLLSALILFYSDFKGSRSLAPDQGFFGIVVGSIITYAIALAVSAVLLWFFGSFDGFALATRLAATVVLGVATVLGASAGRLLLQGQ